MTETINDKFTAFLNQHDTSLVEKWEKFKSKTPRKNPYIFFREVTREKVKEEYPSFTNKEITEECSKRWSDLKEAGGAEYDKYVDLAKVYSKHATDPEVSKPFHSFSLANRATLVDEHPGKSAFEITDLLKEMWKTEDKDNWKI